LALGPVFYLWKIRFGVKLNWFRYDMSEIFRGQWVSSQRTRRAWNFFLTLSRFTSQDDVREDYDA